jgi:hypothetical protein
MERIEIETPLVIWHSAESNTSSGYVRITGDAADAIRLAALTGQWLDRKGRFGTAKVTATIGGTSWANSVFPDKESGGWFMPVKKAVRLAEGLEEGEMVKLTVEL